MPVRPKREARVPLQLSEAQLECYRDVLARRFDVLADPKRPRHSAQRTSEMRALCAELRKVGSYSPACGVSHESLTLDVHAAFACLSPLAALPALLGCLSK